MTITAAQPQTQAQTQTQVETQMTQNVESLKNSLATGVINEKHVTTPMTTITKLTQGVSNLFHRKVQGVEAAALSSQNVKPASSLTPEVQQARELLKDVKNILLTPNELITFSDTDPLSSIKLLQAGNGNSMLTEITADITNKGIETLLNAAERGLVDQKEIYQVTNQEIGQALFDVFMEDKRPRNLELTDIAIWPSKSEPGKFAVKLSGSKNPQLVNDKAAALEKLGAHIQDQLGSPIDVKNTESEYYSSVAVPTISAHSKGQLNLSLPYGLHFDDMPEVTGTFEQVKTYVAEAHEAMLNKAAEAQKETRDNLSVGKFLPQLSDNMDKLRETLAPPRKGADDRYLQKTNEQVALNRFGNIQSLEHSSLNPNLNANRININGKNVAIATQYPYEHQIPNHLRMLVDNNIPVVTVIAEQSQMEEPTNNMSDYFSGNLDVDTIYSNINPEPI